jgi:hypothetical protein
MGFCHVFEDNATNFMVTLAKEEDWII